jgi:hypothetical protein
VIGTGKASCAPTGIARTGDLVDVAPPLSERARRAAANPLAAKQSVAKPLAAKKPAVAAGAVPLPKAPKAPTGPSAAFTAQLAAMNQQVAQMKQMEQALITGKMPTPIAPSAASAFKSGNNILNKMATMGAAAKQQNKAVRQQKALAKLGVRAQLADCHQSCCGTRLH